MCTDHLLANIECAALSATGYRAARRLLDRISAQQTVYLSAEEACDVCGVDTWGAAKRILKHIADAGVFQLHTNNCAYITFPRAEMDLQRAETARQEGDQRAETDRQRAETARQELTEPRQNGAQRAETDRQRAEMARVRAEMARPLLGRLGRKVGRKEIINLPTSEGGAGGTARPEPQEPAERARSVALLVDVGVADRLAIGLAEQYPFQEIRRQVFQFMRDAEKSAGSRPEGPGVIPGRLKRRHPAKIVEDDLDSPLWQQHMTADETHEERRRKYIPDEYADVIAH